MGIEPLFLNTGQKDLGRASTAYPLIEGAKMS